MIGIASTDILSSFKVQYTVGFVDCACILNVQYDMLLSSAVL